MIFNEKTKNILIKYFTKFYGENYRTLITQKINTLVPCFYDSIETRKSVMYTKQSGFELKLILKFLEHHSIKIPQEIKDKCIKNNTSIYLTDISDIEDILRKYFGTYEYKRNGGIRDILEYPSNDKIKIFYSVQALKNYGVEISEDEFNIWVTSLEGKQILEEIRKEKEFLEKLDKEYDKFNEPFKELMEGVEKSYKLKNQLSKKYELIFLELIEKYLTPTDKELLEKYKQKEPKDEYDKIDLFNNLKIFKIVSPDIYTVGLIESFSSRSEELLNGKETNDYKRECIIEDRIKYFTLIGIYDGTPKEEFINSKLAKSNEPDISFIDSVIKAKEKCIQELEEEYFIATSTYKENEETIKSLNLVEKNIKVLNKIKNKTICIELASLESSLNLITLLFFSEGAALNEYRDVLFIHEINHIIESSIIGKDKDGVIHYKTGFEELINDDDHERPYINFSENINQLIAMEVTTLMHKDGVYLFDDPNTSKIRGATTYEFLNSFTNEFYTTFKEILKIARTSNSLEPLYEVVGKDNFEKMNEVINEYSALPMEEINYLVCNGIQNELTMKRDELLSEANQIYTSMLHYKERKAL